MKLLTKKDISEMELYNFLKTGGDLLLSPLSKRVNLKSFLKKVFEFANVLFFKNGNEIVSMIIFYDNDTVNKNAYITFLCTLPKYRTHGCAKKLLNQAILICKENEMKSIYLDTDIANTPAVKLYQKFGFKIINNYSGRIKMCLDIQGELNEK